MLLLISTSTVGIRYDADPRNVVSQGSVTSQESTRFEPISCGRASHNAQVLRLPRPVEVPAVTFRLPRRRAVPLTSTPCQYAVRVSPATFDSLVWKSCTPRAAAAGVIATNVAVLPMSGRSGWLGTGTFHRS